MHYVRRVKASTKQAFLNVWNRTCIVATAMGRIGYRFVEGGTIGALFVMTSYAGWWIVFGDVTNPRYARMMALLPIASQHWKAFLVLLIPLLFRTVRTFAEEI